MNPYRLAVILSFSLMIVGCAGSKPAPTAEPFAMGPESPYRNLDELKEETILHVPTGIEVTKDELIDIIGQSRIVYVGETHTNVFDHRVELDIIKALAEKFPGRIAVGMEMFERSSQPQLDQWSQGKMDDKAFAKIWYENWDQDMDYYRDILYYVRDMKIPLVGLNAPHEQVRLLGEKGLEGLSETERSELPDFDPGDPYHRKSMEAIFGGHIHGKKGFDPFYQTMLLWDETMAQSVVRYLSPPEHQKMKMVVISGGFHVGFGFGIPRRVFRRMPEPYAIVLPYTSRLPKGKEYAAMPNVSPIDIPMPIADFVWAVPYDDLEGKGVRLGVNIEPSDKGVLVKAVSPESAAQKAGIQPGDIITDFGDEPILEPFDLVYQIKQQRAGDRAVVKVLRGDKMVGIEVKF